MISIYVISPKETKAGTLVIGVANGNTTLIVLVLFLLHCPMCAHHCTYLGYLKQFVRSFLGGFALHFSNVNPSLM